MVEEGTISGEKMFRIFLWFSAVWFFLAFINDWLILKGIGSIPIITAMEYLAVEPTAKAWENAFVILLHAFGTIIILFLLLRKKKDQLKKER